jgi:hypothetical protein
MIIEVYTDFFRVISQKPGGEKLGLSGLRCLPVMGFSDECDEPSCSVMKFLGELQIYYEGRACSMASETLLDIVCFLLCYSFFPMFTYLCN